MDSVSRGLVLTLVILGLVALSGPFMMGGMMGPGWMGTDGGWHGGMMWGVGGITMLAFLALVVVGIFVLVRVLDRDTNGPASGRPSRETPLEILDRRYASGELTREQHEQMRRDLGGH